MVGISFVFRGSRIGVDVFTGVVADYFLKFVVAIYFVYLVSEGVEKYYRSTVATKATVYVRVYWF